ncbi:MAG: hypothetical protein LRZ84_12260 [Desertifilum sp.]|nr:hypothetical protein [Desertifilum sp.]
MLIETRFLISPLEEFPITPASFWQKAMSSGLGWVGWKFAAEEDSAVGEDVTAFEGFEVAIALSGEL